MSTEKQIDKAYQAGKDEALSELKDQVLKQLEELGIPKMVSKKELYGVMDVSTPQEIGRIKAYLEFLDMIDNQ